jgi:hypothetical protein
MNQAMRKFWILILIIGIEGCETEPILFKGPYHVRFTETTLTEKESYSPILNIEVHNAGPELQEDVTISYSISGSAREGVDYEIVGTRGKVFINAGEYFGQIKVRLMNNSNNIIRSQDLVLTLTNVNSDKLRVGQSEGGIGTQFTLTIVDDCILGGTYSGTRSAFSIPTTGLKIISSDCINYILSDWDVGIFDYPFPMSLKFIDNGDNSLTIPEQEQEELPEELATVVGIGSVNPNTREIYLIITLVDFDAQIAITLTPE